MTNGNGDEILNQLKERIDTDLNKKRLSQSNRAQLEMMQLFVIYLQNDHPKVMTMWGVFRPMAWITLTFLTAIIGLIVAGRLEIIVR